MAKKSQSQSDYTIFADMYNKPDENVRAFMQKRGPLGLDPRNPTGFSWGYKGVLIQPGVGQVFIPWENKRLINDYELPPIKETPEAIRQEALKMHLFLHVLQIVGECTDGKGRLVFEKTAKRRFEINELSEKLQRLWPDMILLTRVPIPISFPITSEPEMGAIQLPDIAFLIDSVLSRIRLKVARDQKSLKLSSLPFSNKGYHFEFEEGCLLARLWYELISDIIGGKNPPQVCPYCSKLFIPERPNKQYCSYCQKAAKQRRYRENFAMKKGRKIRTTRGRPPKQNIAR